MKRSLPQGFSIIELMISITLGAIIIGTVVQIYLSNKTTNQIQEGLARVQENGRFANYILTHDIRMAGYSGCGNTSKLELTSRVAGVDSLTDFNIPLKGYEGTSGSYSPTLPTYLPSTPAPNTDVIELRESDFLDVQLRREMQNPNNPVLVYDRLGIQPGEIVLITDCEVGDIFIAGASSSAAAITHTNSENTTNDLSIPYLTNAKIMRFFYYAYYVKDSGRTNANGEVINSLYRLNIQGAEEELIEGVERFEVTYGVDTDANLSADTYQNAADVEASNNWGNVISVNINLLLASTENINDKPQSYEFLGTTITPTDRKLRRQWNIFINIRNRGLPS